MPGWLEAEEEQLAQLVGALGGPRAGQTGATCLIGKRSLQSDEFMFCLSWSKIFCVKIVSPMEPRIIIPTDANNSNLTNAELT